MSYEIHVSGHIDSLRGHLRAIVNVDSSEKEVLKITELFRERFADCVVALWQKTERTSYKVLDHNDSSENCMPGFVG